jgi:hypothetical protein
MWMEPRIPATTDTGSGLQSWTAWNRSMRSKTMIDHEISLKMDQGFLDIMKTRVDRRMMMEDGADSIVHFASLILTALETDQDLYLSGYQGENKRT